MKTLQIIAPDDMHLHVRDGAALTTVVPHTARQFRRAIIMPNLIPPITTVQQALAYQQRILNAVPQGLQFQPLMTLYLTNSTSIEDIDDVAKHPDMLGFKLYPAGATTNSEAGVKTLEQIYPLLEMMEKLDVPLLCHGEVTDPATDIFDRERLFLERELEPIRLKFPALRIVLEHITTADGVAFVQQSTGPTAATITAHHLLYNRNALFAGGIRPHYYCLPILKRQTHQQELIKAAISGDSRFFLGTDSAPHTQARKESACGCAGCYTAHAAIELYAEVFEAHDALDKLEGFASQFGAAFYGLTENRGTITLQQKEWQVPESYALEDEQLIPLRSGEPLRWQLV